MYETCASSWSLCVHIKAHTKTNHSVILFTFLLVDVYAAPTAISIRLLAAHFATFDSGRLFTVVIYRYFELILHTWHDRVVEEEFMHPPKQCVYTFFYRNLLVFRCCFCYCFFMTLLVLAFYFNFLNRQMLSALQIVRFSSGFRSSPHTARGTTTTVSLSLSLALPLPNHSRSSIVSKLFSREKRGASLHVIRNRCMQTVCLLALPSHQQHEVFMWRCCLGLWFRT